MRRTENCAFSAAATRIWEAMPNAIVQFELVDLANLKSIATFGARLRGKMGRIN